MNHATEPLDFRVRPLAPGVTPLRHMKWSIRDEGTNIAPPVAILLHGFGQSADIWRASVRFWQDAARAPTIVAFDLPGHGRSENLTPDRYGISEVADRLAREIHILTDGPVVLIGHSIGGRLALALSEKSDISIKGVILIETAVEGIRPASRMALIDSAKAMSSTFSSTADLIAQIMRQTPLAQRHAVSEYVEHAMHATSDGAALPFDPASAALLFDENADLTWPPLMNLQVPLAVINGAYSSFLKETIIRQMDERVSTPLFKAIIPKAGHALPLERPDALGKTLANAYQFVTNDAASADAAHAKGQDGGRHGRFI